jgi:hypothetical protein
VVSRYDPSELRDVLAETAATAAEAFLGEAEGPRPEPVTPDARPRVRVLEDGEVIPEGCRDSTLTSLAGSMRRRGFGENAIRAALLVENAERCRPPLPERDVAKIARSVARYRPQDVPSFAGPPRHGKHFVLSMAFDLEVG